MWMGDLIEAFGFFQRGKRQICQGMAPQIPIIIQDRVSKLSLQLLQRRRTGSHYLPGDFVRVDHDASRLLQGLGHRAFS